MTESLKNLRIFAASPSDVASERSRLETALDSLKPMGQVRQLDKRMNDAGLLRLMVSDPLAMKMSDTPGYLRGELGKENRKSKKK